VKLRFKRVSPHALQANEKQAPEFCGSGGQAGKGSEPVASEPAKLAAVKLTRFVNHL
jgi:hypothetical protein